MAHLPTHVLDTARGTPADELKIDVFIPDGDVHRHVQTTVNDADGRTPDPPIAGYPVPLLLSPYAYSTYRGS